ncbi:hypothetical protein B0J14DRAFT_136419 [Halenospora varia]|nr:hypothetical protein B0J14DRAFT_136419 [Halenospora varia]
MAISFVFVCCRAIIRLKVFGRLWFDDFLLFIAWTSIFAGAILWHKSYRILLSLSDWKKGGVMNASKTEVKHVWNVILVVSILYVVGLGATKLSFLFFSRRLLRQTDMKALEVWWWVVFIITLGSAGVALGSMPYKCLIGSFEQIQKSCPRVLQQSHAGFPAVIIGGIMDVISDLLSESDLGLRLLVCRNIDRL